MNRDLDTLLTALYVLIDDHVVAPRTGRGRRPDVTDSELLCRAVAQVLLGYHGERRWIRHIHTDPRWQSMFPYLPTQSAYNKRLRAAEPLLCQAILALAACCPSWVDDLWSEASDGGRTHHFRYLASGGMWVDEADADGHTATGSAVHCPAAEDVDAASDTATSATEGSATPQNPGGEATSAS